MPVQPTPPTQGENPNTPPQPSPLSMEKFQGLFTSTTRPGVKEEQCWWIDGFMPLGEMNLRTLPDVGPVVWTAPGSTTISVFNFANIGSNAIAVVVLNDGSLYQINTSTNVATLMSGAGTILNPSPLNVGISQYGEQFVLIAAQQLNGYFIWDGTTFFVPGGPSPTGGTMPTAIGGSAVETYQGRVWIANGATIIFSAPGSVDDFSSANGGGNFTSTDSFLRKFYTQLIQTNGFLYLIGDSSINYISGVQTSGTPPITTFTNQNADPEVGTPYPSTVDVFGRNIIFANAWGVHVSYGSAVSKVSEALDGFYTSVPNFGGQIISAAKAIIYGKRVWMLLCPVIDLFTGQLRNKLLMWNGQVWWTSEQSVTLTFIQHQEFYSVLTAWGTDGKTLRPLFNASSVNFTKRVMSKFWAAPIGYQMRKTASRFWATAQYYNVNSPNLTVFVESENSASFGGASEKVLTPSDANSLMTWTTAGGQVMNWTTTGGIPMIWAAIGAGIVVFDAQVVSQHGVYLGFSLETECADMALISAMLGIGAWSYRG